MNFAYCFDELDKIANLGAALKRLALTEVPGTKPWLINKAQTATRHTGKALSNGPKSVPRAAGGSGARSYDVSALARKMGV